MKTMILIVLAFLIQITSSKKYIKFHSRGMTNKCDYGNSQYVFYFVAEYEGVKSFKLFLKEPSYAYAMCSVGYPSTVTCSIDVKTFPLKFTRVELPESILHVDFEYSGWENVISNPIINSGVNCMYKSILSLSQFYPDSKEKVNHTCLSDDKHELKIPGLFVPKHLYSTKNDYELINFCKCGYNFNCCNDNCILSIYDKVNDTHSKSELKCIIEGSKTVELFPTIATDLDNDIEAYLRTSEKYDLNCNSSSSSFFYKVDFLLIFLLLLLF